MGLAPFGDVERHRDLRTVRMTPAGDLLIDFPALYERFRDPNTGAKDVTGIAHYEDLAAHVQSETDAFVAAVVRLLIERHGLRRWCYSGGVALNGITNEHLVRTLGIDLRMNGSCEDNGTAIGAAIAVHHARTGVRVHEPVTDTYGREYGAGVRRGRDRRRNRPGGPGRRAARAARHAAHHGRGHRGRGHRRLVPGPQRVRPTRARQPQRPRRSSRPRHAAAAQRRRERPGGVPAVRARGGGAPGRRLLRSHRSITDDAARRTGALDLRPGRDTRGR
jgi:hypothetical protein